MLGANALHISVTHYQRWLIATGKQPIPADASTDGGKSSKPFVHDGKALFVFGAGPRVCPGQGLAMVTMKVSTLYATHGRMCMSVCPFHQPAYAVACDRCSAFTHTQ
jgi:Cytochrome P450